MELTKLQRVALIGIYNDLVSALRHEGQDELAEQYETLALSAFNALPGPNIYALDVPNRRALLDVQGQQLALLREQLDQVWLRVAARPRAI